MDKNLIKEFVAAVKKQCELYADLKQVGLAQQKILSSKDARGLDETARKQEELVSEIRTNEEVKKGIFGRMASEMGLKNTRDLKLQELLFEAGDLDAAEIGSESARLIGLIEENAQLNSGNARLMKNFIDFAGFSGELREKAVNKTQPLYTPEGIINKTGIKPAKFDQKI